MHARAVLLFVVGLGLWSSCSGGTVNGTPSGMGTCGPGTELVNGECMPTDDATSCGAGTVLEDGECVPNDTLATCGDGTILEGGECVPADTPRVCGAGTTEQSGQCVPNPPPPELAGFLVSVAPNGCPNFVSGVVQAHTTIRAVDGDGNTLTTFAGLIRPRGLGGITVSPTTAAGFVAGVLTVDLTVTGIASAAQIAVFEASDMRASGVSLPFVTVEEQVQVSVTGPAGPTRAGQALADITIDLTTNACRDATNFAGALYLRIADGQGETIWPPQMLVTGAGPHVIEDAVITGAATARSLQIEVAVDDGASDAFAFQIVPPPVFAGLETAYTVPGDQVRLTYSAASGGTGSNYVYHIFRSTTLGDLGTEVGTSTLTSPTIAQTGAVGTVYFYSVRVTDGLADGFAAWLPGYDVQSSAVVGPIVYVAAANIGDAGRNGTPGRPWYTIAEGLTGLGNAGGSIYVITGWGYPDMPFTVPANTHLVGGFTGWVNSATTAADWVRGTNQRSELSTAAAGGMTAPAAITLSANSKLDGFLIAIDRFFGAGTPGSFVSASGVLGAVIRDVEIRGRNGQGIAIADSDVVVTNSVIVGDLTAENSQHCLYAGNYSNVRISDTSLSNCDSDGVYAAYSDLGVFASSIETTINNCIRAYRTDAVLGDVSLSGCGGDGVRGDESALVIERSEVLSASGSCVLANTSQLTIEDSYVSYCNDGVFASGSGISWGVRIANNIITDHTWYGIELASIDGLDQSIEVIGNTIINVKPDGNRPSDSTGIVIDVTQADGFALNLAVNYNSVTGTPDDAYAVDIAVDAGAPEGGTTPHLEVIGNSIVEPEGINYAYSGGVYGYLRADGDLALDVIGNSITGTFGRPGINAFGRANGASVAVSPDVRVQSNSVSDAPLDHAFMDGVSDDEPYTGIVATVMTDNTSNGSATLSIENNQLDGIGASRPEDLGDEIAARGYGYGIDAAALAPNPTLTVVGNRINDVADHALRLEVSANNNSSGVVIADIRDNVVDEVIEGNGIRLLALGWASNLDVEVSNNTIGEVHDLGMDLEVTQYSAGASDKTASMSVVSNTIEHAVNSSGIALDINLNHETYADLHVTENRVERAAGEGIAVDSALHQDSTLDVEFVSNSVGFSTRQDCMEFAVAGYNAGVGSSCNLSVHENWCGIAEDAGFSLQVGYYAAPIGQLSFTGSIENNQFVSTGWGSVLAWVGSVFEAQLVVRGNTMGLAGHYENSAGIALQGQDLPGASLFQVTQNRLLSGNGVWVGMYGYDSSSAGITISNNIVSVTNADVDGVQAYAEFLSGAGAIDVVNNTLLGGYDGIDIYAYTTSSGAPIRIANNVLQGQAAGHILTDVDSATPVIEANMVEDDPGVGEFEGVAEMVSPMDEVIFTGFVDEATQRIQVTQGHIIVGDRVRLGPEDFARTVTFVAGTFIEVDGPMLPTYKGLPVPILVWRASNFVAADPNFRLVDTSDGYAAGTDGTDVGAYGGNDPLAWP